MTASTRMPVYAANWKMNVGPADARAFMQKFVSSYPASSDRRILFFPPAVSLTAAIEVATGRRDIQFGVQNIHSKPNGAYTGEISAMLAKDAGAAYCLVGHSERRTHFGETDDSVRQKCKAALRDGISPLICVGEARYDRVEGRTADVIGRQVRAVISELDPAQIASVMFAYEPLWAIGSGQTASPADASDVHRHIRFLIKQAAGDSIANSVHILYGGSVKPDNAAELVRAPDVDGVLVGGASMDADSWLQIVTA